MEVWNTLTADQRLTVFVAFGSAILGGTLSIVTSWVVVRQTNLDQERIRASDKQDSLIARAQETFVKLLQYANAAYSLKFAIDAQFDSATGGISEELLPVQKVQEILAVDADLEAFSANEMSFLLHSDDAELLGDLLVYEKRVLSMVHTVTTYNEKRRELTKMMEAGDLKVSDETGSIITAEITGKQAVLVDVRMAALNRLLGDIMERLERETNQGPKYLRRFQDAAQKEFGVAYPRLKFEEPVNA